MSPYNWIEEGLKKGLPKIPENEKARGIFMTDEEQERSEFGTGLTYCLGLFLCHTERFYDTYNENYRRIVMPGWFNGASDHLYDIAEEGYPEHIVEKVKELIAFAFEYRYKDCTEDDIYKAKHMALEILMMIDKDMLGVKVIRGEWQ